LQGPSRDGLYPIFLSKSANKVRKSAAFLGITASSKIWHGRLGHPAPPILNKLKTIVNLPVLGSIPHDSVCESCQVAKSKCLPFSDSNNVTSQPLEIIHSDLWSSPISSHNGCHYYVVFIDNYSRFFWIYPLHNKSDTFACFVKFKCLVKNLLSKKIKAFQSDGGGEFTSNQFKQFLNSNGILHRISCAYTPQQNGLAERKHRHIVDTGLALLAQSHLPLSYWVDAFNTATYLINRLPTNVLKNQSHYFKLLHKHPDYSFLKVFGCACYPLLRPYNSHKLMYRSKKCIFLGYCSNYRGYICYDPTSKKTIITRHAVFDETTFPAKDWLSTPMQPPANDSAPPKVSPSTPVIINFVPIIHAAPSLRVDTPASPFQPAPLELVSETVSSPLPRSPTSILASTAEPASPYTNSPHSLSPTPAADATHSVSPIPATAPISSPIQAHVPVSHHPMTTRFQDGTRIPKSFPNYKLFFSTKHPLMALHSHVTLSNLPPTPTRFSQAIKSPHWQQAMQEEFQALQANQTWILCPRLPHHNVITNKWVFKVKQKADGTFDRFKARLVAKGFQQQDGVDYTETFSPVVKSTTIRAILAVAVHFQWPTRQLDVSNAFLHGTLQEDVFMEQPPGFIDSKFPHHVCKLQKSIYGLKQAPRAWFTKLATTLLALGFSESKVDYSLFILHRSDVHLFLLIYVDDIIVTGNSLSAITHLISCLKQSFAMKDLGPLHYFLGIHVQPLLGGLHLSQTKYVSELLDRVHMTRAKPAKTPIPAGSQLSQHDGDPLPNATEYRHLVGALQYCTLTRPDISFAVNQLCQFMHSPTTTHWTAAKRVLRYLKGSINHGLHFAKGSLHLNAYSDSDWAGNPDDRRSTTGYALFLGPCLISWCAKKQSVVSKSSTEAEYRSLALATAELYWLRMLLQELQVFLSSSPTLWCDNLGALALASNPVYHAHTKHIEVDYHFIREKVVNKDITTRYMPTLDQIADIFTKGLTTNRFLLLRDKLKVCSPPISLRGDVRLHEPSKPPKLPAPLNHTDHEDTSSSTAGTVKVHSVHDHGIAEDLHDSTYQALTSVNDAAKERRSLPLLPDTEDLHSQGKI
jgi:hypothetical protein